jgi:hypothetical protein
MKVPSQEQNGHSVSNLAPESEGGSKEGKSLSPPAFQLKASSLADLVSPVAALARNTDPMQMKKLADYNDKDPKHDASLVTEADIKGTDEYTLLMQTYYLVPTTDPSTLYTPEEILMACRLMLRALREGTAVDAATQGKTYLDRARMQLGTATKAESFKDGLNWSSTFPGSNNTDFGKWLLDGGAEPDASKGIMNCWELVMFSAYKAGFASKGGLATVYKQFAADLTTDIPKAVTNFENALKQGKEQVFDPSNADSPRPLRGDIVIFNTLAAHVAIATGGQKGGSPEVMSLWTQNSKKVFQTSIDTLLKDTSGPVRFYSPKWS